MNLEPVIGLEIHIQLKTQSKMFCSCANALDLENPNIAVCPICLGHPGTLPKINEQALHLALRLAQALNFKINPQISFDRKNYFYADLPKGYQISQHHLKLGEEGFLIIKTEEENKIALSDTHLEEDTAKLIHPQDADYSLLDFNRAGAPLLEIVTYPIMKNPLEAKKFMEDLQLICRYLNISDADLEKGQMRCDANISLRPQGEKKFYFKTEIKNLNSFRAIERALEYEIKRQTKLWEQDKAPNYQATRGWDDNQNMTVEHRVKEGLSDYRYFPEPDLPPIKFSAYFLRKIKKEIPELPEEKKERFKKEYHLDFAEIKILISERNLADYTEKVISELKNWQKSLPEAGDLEDEIQERNCQKLAKLASSWIINRLKPSLNRNNQKITDCKITPENLAELITMIYTNRVNSTNALLILEEIVKNGGEPLSVLQTKNLRQMSEPDDLEKIVAQVIKNNPSQVKEYQKGKVNVIQFLIGQVMKQGKGRVNPEMAKDLLEKKL